MAFLAFDIKTFDINIQTRQNGFKTCDIRSTNLHFFNKYFCFVVIIIVVIVVVVVVDVVDVVVSRKEIFLVQMSMTKYSEIGH